MAYFNQDWEKIGRSIQDIVDDAVNSQDYTKLNQNIRNTVERVVDAGADAVKRAADNAAYRRNSRIVEEKKDLSVLYGNPNGKLTAGILKIVGGGFLAALVLAGSIVSLALEFAMGISAGAMGGVLALGGIAGGTGLIASGIQNVNRVNRFKKYRKTLGQKTYCTLEKLAKSVGKSVSFVRRELGQMIDSGLFLEGHLDKEGTSLITSDETFRYYEQSRLQLEQRQQEEKKKLAEAKKEVPSQVREVLDRGNAFITEIRRCNDLIPGEEISSKIDRMEIIVRKIFERARTNPEIVPDLKKMMDYYLPMTVKLLNAYADMDAQPVQGQTIQNSKREIESTLDTLNLAFEKLLDDLFAETALDISSDISVLQTLLSQEGLAEDELSRMKKNRTT